MTSYFIFFWDKGRLGNLFLVNIVAVSNKNLELFIIFSIKVQKYDLCGLLAWVGSIIF